MVGRQRELELLLDAYESQKGRGQAVSIVSEAGIGKSRLLYEFRKAVTNEDVTFLEGKMPLLQPKCSLSSCSRRS